MVALLRSPSRAAPAAGAGLVGCDDVRATMRAGASWPFDALRHGYAAAVQTGIVKRSILASRDIERQLDTMEHLLLGPFARRV